jgi:hypothetical protein
MTSISSTSHAVAVEKSQPPLSISEAEKKLTQTHVDELWTDYVSSVSNWNVFGKLYGIFIYLLYKGNAAQGDKEHGATIAEFNIKLAKLAHTVAARALTNDEADGMGVPHLQYPNDRQQQESAARTKNAEDALSRFYDVFRERCKQLKISWNDSSFGHVVEAAFNKMSQKASDPALAEEHRVHTVVISSKMETEKNRFLDKIYKSMVATYAQEVEAISPESFAVQVKVISGFHSGVALHQIRKDLCSAIKEKHAPKLTKLAADYANAADPKVTEIKNRLARDWESLRADMQKEVDALRGSTGYNGEVHAADKKVKDAKAPYDAAAAEFINAFQTVYDTTVTTPVDELAGLEGTQDPASLKEARVKLLAAQKVYQEEEAKRVKLSERLTELAEFDGRGNLFAGKLFTLIRQDVPQVAEEARKQGGFLSQFYNKLLVSVSVEAEVKTWSSELEEIIKKATAGRS